MAKSMASHISANGQFLSKSEKSDLKTFRTVAADLRKRPAKTVVIKAGIATPGGRLKKAYGGK